ncbi:MAG: L-2-amino-thiazoline-4-carboxylic acid hydrolase [Clostridia bacterium]|nr:L-2-amino-thiazoline-4-carboxylic acid hydrolase [Clostridia bacterium]
MKTAQKIMKKKVRFRTEIDERLPADQSSTLWQKATDKLNELLKRYSSLPKGVRFHTENKILPAAAIYLTLKHSIGQPEAYRVMEDATFKTADSAAKKLAKLLRLPGMQSLFVKLWDPLTRKIFGEKCGFKNVFYPKKKGEYRMDVIACPYFRYFSEIGCPELTKISCGADGHVYGDLPGLKFERTTTIGRGGDRCDFCIRKAREGEE